MDNVKQSVMNLCGYMADAIETAIFTVFYVTARSLFAVVSGVADGAMSAFRDELDWLR
jgi:hypothetical protein